MFNCVDMDWDDDKIDYAKLQVVKSLFDKDLRLDHCEMINNHSSKEINLKFSKKRM